MSVGDVNSNEKGSGARYNDGKVPLDFIPIENWCRYWEANYNLEAYDRRIVHALIEWQQRELLAQDVLAKIHIKDLHEAARVFEFGSKKYAAWNWAKGMSWEIPLGCIMRHFEAIWSGAPTDPESGLSHWGHIVCNIIMLAHFEDYFQEGDTRPPETVFIRQGKVGTSDDIADALNYANEYDEALAVRLGMTSDMER